MEYIVHTPQQLGKVLRGQRKALGFTQQQVGGTVGLLPKTVSRLELEADTATVESLFKLLSALELELAMRPKLDRPSTREW